MPMLFGISKGILLALNDGGLRLRGRGGVDCWPCLRGSESVKISMQNGRQLLYAPLMWPFYEFLKCTSRRFRFYKGIFAYKTDAYYANDFYEPFNPGWLVGWLRPR